MLFLRLEVVTNCVDRPLFPNAVTRMRKLSQNASLLKNKKCPRTSFGFFTENSKRFRGGTIAENN